MSKSLDIISDRSEEGRDGTLRYNAGRAPWSKPRLQNSCGDCVYNSPARLRERGCSIGGEQTPAPDGLQVGRARCTRRARRAHRSRRVALMVLIGALALHGSRGPIGGV